MDSRAVLRRQRVASLLLRGLSPLEIALQLKKRGMRDPQTGEAYPLAVIEEDIAALNASWQSEVHDIATRQGRVLAELREVRRAAWAKGDLSTVLRGLQQEVNLEPPPPPRDFLAVSAADRDLLI